MKVHYSTKQFLLFVCLSLASAVALAQDTTQVAKSEAGSFFMQPWVWITGGAVFILLLVALLRGGGQKS